MRYSSDTEMDVSGMSNDIKFTAPELVPFTNYTFELAAVNINEEVGVYSSPLIVETHEDGRYSDTLHIELLNGFGGK